MRTPLATETLEIAFMLLCFQRCGATLTIPLAWWARKTLAQNGELRPDQIEAIQFESAARLMNETGQGEHLGVTEKRNAADSARRL